MLVPADEGGPCVCVLGNTLFYWKNNIIMRWIKACSVQISLKFGKYSILENINDKRLFYIEALAYYSNYLLVSLYL